MAIERIYDGTFSTYLSKIGGIKTKTTEAKKVRVVSGLSKENLYRTDSIKENYTTGDRHEPTQDYSTQEQYCALGNSRSSFQKILNKYINLEA